MGARGVARLHRFSLKDADEAQTRDLLLARHLLEFRSLDQKGTCRVVAVARERQMPESILAAILETYAQGRRRRRDLIDTTAARRRCKTL